MTDSLTKLLAWLVLPPAVLLLTFWLVCWVTDMVYTGTAGPM